MYRKHTPNASSDTKPSDRLYKCEWNSCKKDFKEIKHLHSHMRDHSGSQSDSFFQILLNDQAKALSQPSTSMRWHPLIIKWCLRTWSKSHSIYNEIRDSNFFKLPSGRTLNDYKNFNHPQSGWQEQNITAMKTSFQKTHIPQRGMVGGWFLTHQHGK